MDREKISANHQCEKELISRLYKEFSKLYLKTEKKNNPVKKMGKKLKTLHQKRYINDK